MLSRDTTCLKSAPHFCRQYIARNLGSRGKELPSKYNGGRGSTDTENTLVLDCVICVQLMLHTQQAQNICITFVQGWTNVFDVGPTLYKCYTDVSCLLGSYKSFSGFTTYTLGHRQLVQGPRRGVSNRHSSPRHQDKIYFNVCVQFFGPSMVFYPRPMTVWISLSHDEIYKPSFSFYSANIRWNQPKMSGTILCITPPHILKINFRLCLLYCPLYKLFVIIYNIQPRLTNNNQAYYLQ